MIIKKRDSKETDIKELTALLSLPLPENKRFLIGRELGFVKSGDRGENDSAYFIDFIYSDSKNWAVIHDLRLELNGKVAQIDHLMINKMFDCYVLETKNFSYLVKITENGEFLVEHNNKYLAIESPIEQNKRHIHLLKKLLDAREIMPTRLGLRIAPTFKSYVLVSPKSRVIRPSRDKFDTSMVIKADTLETTIMDNAEHMSTLTALAAGSKMVSSETLFEVAHNIAKLHRPARIDYRERFRIEDTTSIQAAHSNQPVTEQSNRFYCIKCKKTIPEKVARFCWDNKKRFGGKAYCFDCQKGFPK
jgi:hypothetical protein